MISFLSTIVSALFWGIVGGVVTMLLIAIVLGLCFVLLLFFCGIFGDYYLEWSERDK